MSPSGTPTWAGALIAKTLWRNCPRPRLRSRVAPLLVGSAAEAYKQTHSLKALKKEFNLFKIFQKRFSGAVERIQKMVKNHVKIVY
jgi:hypothetical protein